MFDRLRAVIRQRLARRLQAPELPLALGRLAAADLIFVPLSGALRADKRRGA